jgi:hypothetical protein
MSIDFELFCFIVSFKMPNAVELSVRSGVAGWTWPTSVSVTLSGDPLWAFWKHAPTSDSAAEATTFFRTDATLRVEPFSVSSCEGVSPQKNKPLRRMSAFETEMYDVPLCMCIFMLNA